MTKKLYEKFENYLKEYKLYRCWYIEKNNITPFMNFLCENNILIGFDSQRISQEAKKANIEHNKKILKYSTLSDKEYIKASLKLGNKKRIEDVICDYLEARKKYIDDENKMLFLYIDFKDDAELNELTEIETQMLRNIFKETHEKYNTGWYNAE